MFYQSAFDFIDKDFYGWLLLAAWGLPILAAIGIFVFVGFVMLVAILGAFGSGQPSSGAEASSATGVHHR